MTSPCPNYGSCVAASHWSPEGQKCAKRIHIMMSSWCRRATHHHDKSFDINDDSLPPTRHKTSINMCLSTWIEREDVKELWIALPMSEVLLFYYIFSLMTSRKLNSMLPGRTPCGSFAEEASRSVALIEKVWFRKENTEMCYQPWRCSCDLKLVIFKLMSRIYTLFLSISSSELALGWMPQEFNILSRPSVLSTLVRKWLGAVRQQAITRANADSDQCRHMGSLGSYELTYCGIGTPNDVSELQLVSTASENG